MLTESVEKSKESDLRTSGAQSFWLENFLMHQSEMKKAIVKAQKRSESISTKIFL
jgi:hypothetical protein